VIELLNLFLMNVEELNTNAQQSANVMLAGVVFQHLRPLQLPPIRL